MDLLTVKECFKKMKLDVKILNDDETAKFYKECKGNLFMIYSFIYLRKVSFL